MTLLGEHVQSEEREGPLRVGDVVTVQLEEKIDRLEHAYTRRLVRVGDESDANVQLREMYRLQGAHFEQALKHNLQWRATVAGHGEVYIPEENQAARWLYYDKDGRPTQMLAWAKRFPTAIALEPLQRLSEGGAWLPGGELDARTLELFTNMVDGIGLRSRARIYRQRLVDHVEETGQETLSVVSLGSGASVPNIEATRALEKAGVAVDWRFYDFDPQALLFAKQLIEHENFSKATFDYGPTWENPDSGAVEPKGQNYLRAFSVEEESVDVVDALGLWEYLTADQAEKFVHKLYSKLKPGGVMLVSNMLPTRPEKEFNQRAVGWPDLYLRDEAELLSIIDAAGIDTRQVTMTLAEDGVYVVVEMRKPS